MARAHLALCRGGADTAELDEEQMDSRLVLTLALAGVMALTACTGQQATTAASSKAGGPKIELAGTTPDPCPPARCAVSVLVKNDQGQPIENADVRYEARHTGMSMGSATASATAENRGSGRYEGAVNFSMSGDWNVGVNVRLPGNNTVYAETIKLGVK